MKPIATFFWVQTFPLKIYAPAILPMMAVYVSLAMEVMGMRSHARTLPLTSRLLMLKSHYRRHHCNQ